MKGFPGNRGQTSCWTGPRRITDSRSRREPEIISFTGRAAGRLCACYAGHLLILLLVSGNPWWTEAWLYCTTVLLFGCFLLLQTRKVSPSLLEHHMNPWPVEARKWDSQILTGSPLLYGPTLALSAVDVAYTDIIPVPVIWKGIGFGFFVVSLMIMLSVITTEPFTHDRALLPPVRHPVYGAAIISLASIPVALGSFLGLLPALIITAILLVKIPREEQKMSGQLEWYDHYATAVRYRLVPGLF